MFLERFLHGSLLQIWFVDFLLKHHMLWKSAYMHYYSFFWKYFCILSYYFPILGTDSAGQTRCTTACSCFTCSLKDMGLRSYSIVKWYSAYIVFFKMHMKIHVITFLMKCIGYTGTTVKYVLEQDKESFIRLIGVSVLQSAASSFIAPSLR